MRLSLDLNTVEGYRTFLKVKALPVHRFVGREAYFPDEYADRIGVERSKDKPSKYVPRPCIRRESRLPVRRTDGRARP
jgi:hypothetical protein